MLTRRIALATAALALLTSVSGCKSLFKKRKPPRPAFTMTISTPIVHVGDTILIDFGAPLTADPGEQYWTNMVPVGSPDDTWGAWHYLPPDATSDQHVAAKAGAFELRLHDTHPSGELGVLVRVPLTVRPMASKAPPTATATATGSVPEPTGERPTFTIAGGQEAYTSGDKIKIVFSEAMRAPRSQQYWITIAPAGSPDASWGKWHFVKSGAKLDELDASESGDFEIRLHDFYPAHDHGVLARKSVRVN